jgi:hypothetical protein
LALPLLTQHKNNKELNLIELLLLLLLWGQAVAKFFEALYYKPEGRGINSRLGGFLQFIISFKPHYGTGFDSTSTRN